MSLLNRIETAILLIPAAALLLFYLVFACGSPVRWPYYSPEIEGATIDDPVQFFMPRANLSPRASLQLSDGVSLRTRMGCYPSASDGTQSCSFQVRFFNPENATISFAAQPVSVRSADGEELIDKDFYIRFADRMRPYDPPVVRNEEVFLTYGRQVVLMLSTMVLPERFVATIPDLVIGSQKVSVPPITFRRHENLTCVGLIANY